MSEEDKSKWLDRIRKMLAKAEDPACPPAEAAALNDKVAELIAKYGIEQALLANEGLARDEVGDKIIVVEAPYMMEKCTLLNGVGIPLRVQSVRRLSTKTRTSVQMHLFGFEADLERVELLYTSLLVQASYGVAAAAPGHLSGQSLAAWKRSWLQGFTVSVHRRLESAENRAKQEADEQRKDGQPSTDLVLVTRDQLVTRRKLEAYPDFRAGKRRRLSGGGYRQGKEAGERADLGGTRISRPAQKEVGR